jgi:hypothetical protein
MATRPSNLIVMINIPGVFHSSRPGLDQGIHQKED